MRKWNKTWCEYAHLYGGKVCTTAIHCAKNCLGTQKEEGINEKERVTKRDKSREIAKRINQGREEHIHPSLRALATEKERIYACGQWLQNKANPTGTSHKPARILLKTRENNPSLKKKISFSSIIS